MGHKITAHCVTTSTVHTTVLLQKIPGSWIKCTNLYVLANPALVFFFVILKTSGYSKYHQAYRQTILRSAHTVYLCVLCGSENKQRLFPYTTLTAWFLYSRRRVYCVVRTAPLGSGG